MGFVEIEEDRYDMLMQTCSCNNVALPYFTLGYLPGKNQNFKNRRQVRYRS